MEISAMRWLSELGMDQDASVLFQHDLSNSLDHLSTQQLAAALGLDHFPNTNLSSESYNTNCNYKPCVTPKSYSSMETAHPSNSETPTKQLKNSDWNKSPDSPKLLSFGNLINSGCNTSTHENLYGNELIIPGLIKAKDESPANSPTTSNIQSDIDLTPQGLSYMDPCYGSGKIGIGQKRSRVELSAKPPHTQDHIIAERKRREKLSQRFIALSAIIPGLKKMDKASVLGDAIKYLKQLQERVKMLEDQTEKKTIESVVFVRKSIVSFEEDSSFTDENFDGRRDEPLPEIEARVSDKQVLIRIQCEKKKGVMVRTMAEIEQLHLSVVSSSVIPFANSALDITVVAQMEEKFDITMKELVRRIRAACTNFI